VTARREHLIADEASAAVRAAQDALNEQVRRGALTNDPLRHYLEAMSVALGAMHKMFVVGTLTIAEAVEEAKPQPVDHDTLRFAIIQGIRAHAGGILRTIRLTTYIAGAALLLGMFAAGYGTHWWMTPAVSYAGIRQGPDVCEPRPDGQLCRIPVFLPKQ
jgi:hypothetical protein